MHDGETLKRAAYAGVTQGGKQMNIDEFWRVIDQVHEQSAGVMDTKCELLKSELDKLSDDDLKSFSNHFDTVDVQAYSWSLWGAAYVMNGGCSNDSFSDFRATLISLGRNVYDAALRDPNSLAQVEYDDNDSCYEGFQYVRNDVLESRFGDIPSREIEFPTSPSGEEWDEDSVEELYPELKYLEEVSAEVTNPKPWWKFW